MRPGQQIETFPDGLVDIYDEADRKLGARKVTLCFEEQSVGVARFYQSQESIAGNRIDRVVKVPHTSLVDRLNIAIVRTDGRQYRINRIQGKPERGVDLLELQSVAVAIAKGESS